jgi:hypothetical protein
LGVVVVGVDIGQKHDPTAIAVVEHEWRTRDGREEDHWLVRHLERLPLGTPYPQVSDRLTEVVGNVKERKRKIREPLPWGGYEVRIVTPSVTIYIDATGVGQPVVDEISSRGLSPIAVYFTHGDKRTEEGWSGVKLGKAWLVSRLQTLLQGGRIHLPNTQETQRLAQELLDYEIRVSEDANDRYGAFKVGTHDDLVTALGLAVQQVPWRPLIARA